MSEQNDNIEIGVVKISDDVVIAMAGIATSNVKGVYSAQSEGLGNLFSKNSIRKGIKVEINNNTVTLDININVEYGLNIADISKEVQASVKKEIETMTDLTVSAVNVNVVNIILEKDNQ